MRDSSWAQGEPAHVRRETYYLGPPMATRDKQVISRGNHPGNDNPRAFAGLNIQRWEPRYQDNRDRWYDARDNELMSIGTDDHKRRGE